MRTDVKVGLICAFAIVLCVVIYFVARGNNTKHPVPVANSGANAGSLLPTNNNSGALPDSTAVPAVASAPSNAVGGGLIGLPSTVTPAPSGLANPSTPAPSTMTVLPTTPGMGPSLATSGAGAPGAGASGYGTSGYGTFGSATPTSASPSLGSTSSASTPSILPADPTLSATPSHSTLDVTALPRVTGTPSLAVSAGPTTYKIQQGDTPGSIAHKFNVTSKALLAANPGMEATRLKINSVIKIPASTPAVAHSSTATPATPRTAAAAPSAARTTVAAPTIKPGTTYKVKKGDTLNTIARAAYGTASGGVRKIFQANRSALTDPDLVPVGAEIVIPQ
jgi:DNA segregation ATPase FtsK/SpoIIIE, S-DNA-T family